MNPNMARDPVDEAEIRFDLSHTYPTPSEENAQRQAAAKLVHDPVMLETLYELPEQVAAALAGAIETGNVNKLAALIQWDIENYLDENGGIESWVK